MSLASASILAIVPARAGSKGVPKKNLHLLADHPLLAYAVVAGCRCPEITRTIISTDSPELAEVAVRYGAEAPFVRPTALAADTSPDIDYVLHALEWFEQEEGWQPEFVVQLRPTTPLRNPEKIAESIRALAADSEATSLRSAHELNEPPHKMFQIVKGRFTGFFPDDPRPDYFNLPRQSFPKAYYPNGYVDICRSKHVLAHKNLYGPSILPFITEVSAEIDSPSDFAFLEWQLGRQPHAIVAMLADSTPHSPNK